MNKVQEEKYILARKSFLIEKMLGREFKQFNFINMRNEGNYFSSSNNRFELLQYIKNIEEDGVQLYYLLISKEHEDKNNRLFFIHNSGNDYTYNNVTINSREWFHWGEKND